MADVAPGTERPRGDLLRIFRAALSAVNGCRCVREALGSRPVGGPFYLVAIGKAAEAMARGACRAVESAIVAGLVITKHGHAGVELRNDTRFTVLESDHPLPGEASLAAGEALLRFLAAAPADARFLFLFSGGASSLVEVLPPGVELASYRKANDWLLGSGLDIHEINAVRKRLSTIKGGKLQGHLGGREARCLLISDVPGDNPASIGSGLLVAEAPGERVESAERLPDWLRRLLAPVERSTSGDRTAIPHDIIADNRRARAAACAEAERLGYATTGHEGLLVGDALEAGRRCAREVMVGPGGVSVWGGETTIVLPDRPGRGGRNQSIALAAALALAGRDDCAVLAAGSDGTDGRTEDAGAVVDGGTVRRGEAEGFDAMDCLTRADAGTFLAASGDLIQTGPTGTNVMDLLIGIKRR